MTEKQKLYKELSDSITRVFDAENVEILFTKAEIKDAKLRFSSVGKECPTLFLDGKPYSTRTKIRVEYKCRCGEINNILLCKFKTKNRLCCNHCREDENKVRWHKLFFEMKKNGLERGYREKPHRNYDFNAETDEFKKQFYTQNLTQEEFENIKPYIFSVKNVEIKNLEDFVLLEHEDGKNSKKYRQMVLIDGIKYPFKEIKLKCPICGEIFSISRPIKERVLHNNLYCRYCCLNNKVFMVKKYRDGLTYQSGFELLFIRKCDENNIVIQNGAILPYNFKNKMHEYRIDFYLPQCGLQIELKDNHVWHKKQVTSGKWEAKENAAKAYCKQNGMIYKILFPTDLDDFFNTLRRDSLNFAER